MPLSNVYSLKTAAKDQKPCFICGKSSNSVLDAPDDFFFVCLSHTKDPGFCTSEAIKSVSIERFPSPANHVENSKESSPASSPAKNSELEPVPKVFIYKLHRSILYLREEEKKKKDRLSLLKSLNKK